MLVFDMPVCTEKKPINISTLFNTELRYLIVTHDTFSYFFPPYARALTGEVLTAIVTGETADEVYEKVRHVIELHSSPSAWLPSPHKL